MATDNDPGVDSMYAVIPSVAAAKTVIDNIPDVDAAQDIKDILTRKTMRSIYVWWGDNINTTNDGKIFIEIPKTLEKVQRYLKNNYPNAMYDKVTVQPLLPTVGDVWR